MDSQTDLDRLSEDPEEHALPRGNGVAPSRKSQPESMCDAAMDPSQNIPGCAAYPQPETLPLHVQNPAGSKSKQRPTDTARESLDALQAAGTEVDREEAASSDRPHSSPQGGQQGPALAARNHEETESIPALGPGEARNPPSEKPTDLDLLRSCSAIPSSCCPISAPANPRPQGLTQYSSGDKQTSVPFAPPSRSAAESALLHEGGDLCASSVIGQAGSTSRTSDSVVPGSPGGGQVASGTKEVAEAHSSPSDFSAASAAATPFPARSNSSTGGMSFGAKNETGDQEGKPQLLTILPLLNSCQNIRQVTTEFHV